MSSSSGRGYGEVQHIDPEAYRTVSLVIKKKVYHKSVPLGSAGSFSVPTTDFIFVLLDEKLKE